MNPNDTRQNRSAAEERLATGLGWFSIGLGLAEVVAPGRLAQIIGMKDSESTRALLRFYGMREIAAGVGILSQPNPSGWLWGRVGGDLLDLATLTSALGSEETDKGKLGVATAAVLGVTALDVLCAQRLSSGSSETDSGTRVEQSLLINKSPEEVYTFWRNFENFPSFMSHLESVEVTGDRHSRWRAKAPAGRTVEWTAEITEDQPNNLIRWRSVEGSDITNSGHVHFERAPGDRGTYVKVHLNYDPPAGALGVMVAKLFGEEPNEQIKSDLRRFKQILETGEVVHSDSSIHKGMHPAQPSAESPAALIPEYSAR